MLRTLQCFLPLLFCLVSSNAAKNLSPRNELLAPASQIVDLVRVETDPNPKSGIRKLLGLGIGIAAPIKIGRQKFNLLVDTGSSDTWVISDDFQCADASNQTVPQSTCNLGNGFQLPGGFEKIPRENFYIKYASTNFASGLTGTVNVAIAGIQVPDQRINIAERVYFVGTPEISGFLGLAYPSLTSAFHGTDPTKNTFKKQDEYDPLFTTMYKKNITQGLFSIAIDRAPEGLAGGGQIAFGGLPRHVPYYTPVAATPIIVRRVVKPGYPKAKTELSEYTIKPNGYIYGPQNEPDRHVHKFDERDAGLLKERAREQYPTIIDTGTSLSFVPALVADNVNGLFDPPASYNPDAQLYFTSCNATVPRWGVIVDGIVFYMRNDTDYLVPVGGGTCYTTISKNLRAFGSQRIIHLLGLPWLLNVLAIFDVEHQELRIAARKFKNAPAF